MNFRSFFLLFIAVFPLLKLSAQYKNLPENVEHILAKNGEIIFSFTVNSKEQINDDLTRIISIDYVKALPNQQGYWVKAYANREEFEEFLTRNIPYEIIPKTSPKLLTMATTVAGMANWDAYPTYSVYEQMMANFAANYPNLCDIDTILAATPSGNYRILVAKISDNVHVRENEPQFLYTSSMHGDETTGYVLMLRLINYLLTNYGTNPQVTNLVDNVEIWINPLANPEGTYYNSSPPGSTVANSRRYNLSGIDLNRNYPDPRVGQHPDGNAWQPETVAFMAFADAHNFNMGANFHGGAEVMNYPWDTWTSSQNPNADAAWWEYVCTNYVTTARAIDPNYMKDVVSDGVTEGGDWYVITGGRQDYMNYFKFCREVTIELDGTKTTETQNLPGEWNKNYQALLNYMQESLNGIRGIITDSCTGQPIRAKVWANGHDQVNDSSQVYSALPVGNYHKYKIAGTYSLTFSAPGYISKTINNITVTNGNATIVNVALAPAIPTANFTANVTSTCTGTVNFTDLSTGGATSWVWNFGDGFGSTSQNPTHTYTASGTYTVSLTVSNCKGGNTLTKTNYITVNLATAPTVTGDSVCENESATLTANGSGTINWYDSSSGGNLLFTGSSFTTPPLTNSTTYYAVNQEYNSQYVGKPDSVGGGNMYNSTSYYLIFTCTTPCTLNSVKVYANSAGNRTIALENSSGVTLQSTTVNIPAGVSRVELNFPIPLGTNLRLRLANGSTSNLYRNYGGISYPYNLAGKISITGTNAASLRYYFFYDWEIDRTICSSGYVPVTAHVSPLPDASFTSSVNGATVTFTNTSANANSFLWKFGDGSTGTQVNPVHTYTSDGTYQVVLIAYNSCGADSVIFPVTISTVGGINAEEIISSIHISPNPSKGIINVYSEKNLSGNCRMEIINLIGEKIKELPLHFTEGNNVATVDLRNLTKGLYFARISYGEYSVVRKIILE